jgi:hypothetical protein
MPVTEGLRDRLAAPLELAGALRDRTVARLERAEDPQQVAALATLWGVWLGGAVAFAGVDRFVAGVDVAVVDVGSVVVTLLLVAVTAATLAHQY